MNQKEKDVALQSAIAEATAINYSDDRYWKAVMGVRGAGLTTARLADLMDSDDARLRALVPDVLQSPRDDAERVVALELMRKMLPLERSPRVLESLVAALNELAPADLVDTVLPLAGNADGGVRHAVAVALGGSRDIRAIEALLKLSEDGDSRVRNWAVFGLSLRGGESTELADSAEIRRALVERLTDTDDEVVAEAALGLALRRDPHSIQTIINALEHGTEWSHYVEASYYMASGLLCPALKQFFAQMNDEERSYWENVPKISISRAISACCGNGGELK